VQSERKGKKRGGKERKKEGKAEETTVHISGYATVYGPTSLLPCLHDRTNIEQTSSRPDGTPPPGSYVGLGLAHR